MALQLAAMSASVRQLLPTLLPHSQGDDSPQLHMLKLETQQKTQQAAHSVNQCRWLCRLPCLSWMVRWSQLCLLRPLRTISHRVHTMLAGWRCPCSAGTDWLMWMP